MTIDPKYLRPKKPKTKLTHVSLPASAVQVLKGHGVNLSKVCQDALSDALTGASMPANEETVQVSFKVDAELLERFKAYGLNMRQTIEVRFIELVGQLTKGSRKPR